MVSSAVREATVFNNVSNIYIVFTPFLIHAAFAVKSVALDFKSKVLFGLEIENGRIHVTKVALLCQICIEVSKEMKESVKRNKVCVCVCREKDTGERE